MKLYEIYLITNLVNGKVYVGQSKRLKTRWYEHQYDAEKGKKRPLYDAMRKYRPENFELSVIEKTETKEEADSCEIFWVSFYGSTRRSFGYNLSIGGGGSKGYKHSEAYCIQLGNRRHGVRLSPETREKIRVATSKHRHGEVAKAKLSALRGEIANHFDSSIKTEDIIRLNKEGLSNCRIAKSLGVSTSLVRGRLKSVGLFAPPNKIIERKQRLLKEGKGHLVNPDSKDLERLYLENKLNCWEIGEIYEMSEAGVNYRLNKLGTKMRPKFQGKDAKIIEPSVEFPSGGASEECGSASDRLPVPAESCLYATC